MKKEDDDILAQFGKDPGFKVPEGYFSEFAKRMAESLPEKKVAVRSKATVWTRVRPWVYMAAMFAGVWLMMYMFSDLKSRSEKPYFNEQIADAMSNEEFVDDYRNYGDISDYELMKQLYEEGSSTATIESDTSIN